MDLSTARARVEGILYIYGHRRNIYFQWIRITDQEEWSLHVACVQTIDQRGELECQGRESSGSGLADPTMAVVAASHPYLSVFNAADIGPALPLLILL